MSSLRSLVMISTVASVAIAWTPYTPSSASGACSLISRQEAANALGAAVPAGQEKQMDFAVKDAGSVKSQMCLYGSEVAVTRFELGPKASALFAQYRQSLASTSDYQAEKGVGDEAFFAKGQIAVRKGSTGLIIDVGQNRGGGAKERMKERNLALLAAARL